MRSLFKNPISIICLAAAFCLLVTWHLQSRAHDFWGYSKLGVSDGTPQSASYYLKVRGVGSQPTIARLGRFQEMTAAPRNALEISQGVLTEFDSFTKNLDRWNSECMLIAGSANHEKIMIPIDSAIAKNLFTRPGTQFDSYQVL